MSSLLCTRGHSRMSFADRKLSIPWTYLYSSRDVAGLEKLVITFVHDEYDVLQLDYKPYCKFSAFSIFCGSVLLFHFGYPTDGTNLDIISKGSYPPVEIEYRWESVKDDDVASAMQLLFLVTVIFVGFIVHRTCSDLNRRTSAAPPSRPTATGSSRPGKTNIH